MANITGKESAVIHMGAKTQNQDMDSTARSFKTAKNAEIRQTKVMIPELLVVECIPDSYCDSRGVCVAQRWDQGISACVAA